MKRSSGAGAGGGGGGGPAAAASAARRGPRGLRRWRRWWSWSSEVPERRVRSDTQLVGQAGPVVDGGAEQLRRAERPLVEQVGVVLPGEADAAVELDRLVGRQQVGVAGLDLRRRGNGGDVSLLAGVDDLDGEVDGLPGGVDGHGQI